jgi:hypothetical protein
MEKNEKAIKQISFSHKSKCITSSQCYDLAFFPFKKTSFIFIFLVDIFCSTGTYYTLPSFSLSVKIKQA